MKLKEYMEKKNIKIAGLAFMANCSDSTLYKIRNGTYQCSKELAARIIDECDGEVTLKDLGIED